MGYMKRAYAFFKKEMRNAHTLEPILKNIREIKKSGKAACEYFNFNNFHHFV